MKKADLVGHLSTCLHRRLTGARVTDPSNASFMGLYSTLKLSDWSDELIDAIGASRRLLPDILESDRIAGRISASAAATFGLTEGTPMLVGCMDGSAAMLLAGASVGQMMDVSGSTDVLALCTDRPRPDPRLLTRALGIGQRWLMVSTIAAAGSALSWMKQQFFPDLPDALFWKLASTLAARPDPSTVQFDPYLAGDRMSIAQRTAAFTGLTLASTREHMLSAVIESLACGSAERIPLLRRSGTRMRRRVMASGGVRGPLEKVLHRDWPGKWTFFHQEEATLRGLGRIKPRD
jgi:xylulokinase